MSTAEGKAIRRVLVVDDSVLVQRMIRDYFEPEGYEVVTAANGREGLREARQRRPSVIIADVIMPVMDGWEFCEAIRSDRHTADIPFLFLTAVRETPKRIQGLRMGADDYITKPFSREELLARVEVCLAKMERLRNLESPGAGTALSGHTSHLGVSDLLQLLSLNGKTGTLHLTSPNGPRGRIFLRDGRVVDALAGGAGGRKAVYRLLDWKEARFDFDPEADLPERELIQDATSNLLMEGFTHNDEMRRVQGELPPPQQLLRVARGASRMPAADDLSTVQKAVLTEFQGGAAPQDVLDRSPLPDLEVARAILVLRQRGLLEPVEGGM